MGNTEAVFQCYIRVLNFCFEKAFDAHRTSKSLSKYEASFYAKQIDTIIVTPLKLLVLQSKLPRKKNKKHFTVALQHIKGDVTHSLPE